MCRPASSWSARAGSARPRRPRRSRRTSTPPSSRRRSPVPARADATSANASGVAGLTAGDPAGARSPAGTVAIRSLGKTFRRAGRRTVALAGVDLTVEAGELVCLLGPSGCGKSTLLRIVAGALAADEGTVTVGGRPVTGPSADRGMLFQTPMLFGWLTTRNNVLFGPRAQRA